jgi:hypothetical protein
MNAMQLAVRNLMVTTRPPVADSHKHCKRCGEDRPKEDFFVKSNGQLNHTCLICSPRPDKRNRPKPKTTHRKTCPGCGKRFQTTNSTKQSCSETCATKVHNQRSRDQHRAKVAAPKAEYQRVIKERLEAHASR